MIEGPVYEPGGDWVLPGPDGVRVSGSYGGGDGGAGFEYDEETLRELMHEWNDLANEFEDDLQRAALLQRAQGPGAEYASSGNAEQVRASGDALYETLVARARYCRSMAQRFKTALGKYATAEESSATEVKRTGGSL
ncbi:hypothetical protein [Amycolatopsis vancoresmycina]|uniref:PE-PGRS family protein n=1 Tax=Amycolatopsis vancoresmycina DSM 44592 TaxID=1292037 RepID=R1G7T6_9PSEU|nr:hypothetical protein [Amycolatopsis vancoresmycina]EOD67468.1 hypothetical protein H480_16051 [Amycolatopsis vancoresmycina DSM 44592]